MTAIVDHRGVAIRQLTVKVTVAVCFACIADDLEWWTHPVEEAGQHVQCECRQRDGLGDLRRLRRKRMWRCVRCWRVIEELKARNGRGDRDAAAEHDLLYLTRKQAFDHDRHGCPEAAWETPLPPREESQT